MSGKRGRPRKAHGVTYEQDGYWYFTLGYVNASNDKAWYKQTSGIAVGNTEAARRASKRRAEEMRRQAQNALNSTAETFDIKGASLTVAQLARHFYNERQRMKVASWTDERQRLEDYIIPEIGHLLVIDVRPRHLIEAYGNIARKTYRRRKLLSKKTINETHRTLDMFFQHAIILDLIRENPCEQVGPRYRKSTAPGASQRKTTGTYQLEEIARLISEPSIPLLWRCVYGVEALGMMRGSELGRLRQTDWDPSTENTAAPVGERTLGQLWPDGRKSEWREGDITERCVPVHPALGALLAEWRLHGFFDAFGRQPREDDPLLPYVRIARSKKAHGTALNSNVIYKQLNRDLLRLGMRPPGKMRGQHAFRRAGSAALADAGVSRHDARLLTHKADFADMQVRYDAPTWRRLSECVLKIKLPIVRPPEVVKLPAAVAGDVAQAENPSTQVTEKTEVSGSANRIFSDYFQAPSQGAESTEESAWRRRESNLPSIGSPDGIERKSRTESSRGYTGLAPVTDGPSADAGGSVRTIGRENNAAAVDALKSALGILENRTRSIGAGEARAVAVAHLKGALGQLPPRAAWLIDVAIHELASGNPQSVSPTIVGKALTIYALRTLAGPA